MKGCDGYNKRTLCGHECDVDYGLGYADCATADRECDDNVELIKYDKFEFYIICACGYSRWDFVLNPLSDEFDIAGMEAFGSIEGYTHMYVRIEEDENILRMIREDDKGDDSE